MFSDLYDYISLLLYWLWPSVEGQITAVRILGGSGRFLVEYKFSLEMDLTSVKPVALLGLSARQLSTFNETFPIGQSMTVRYRPDNPSVNKLDRSVWQNIEGL